VVRRTLKEVTEGRNMGRARGGSKEPATPFYEEEAPITRGGALRQSRITLRSVRMRPRAEGHSFE